MRIFDLSHCILKNRENFSATVWDDNDTQRVKKQYFGPSLSLMHLTILLCNNFNDFPSFVSLNEEMEVTHKLNTKNKKNSFGVPYPITYGA